MVRIARKQSDAHTEGERQRAGLRYAGPCVPITSRPSFALNSNEHAGLLVRPSIRSFLFTPIKRLHSPTVQLCTRSKTHVGPRNSRDACIICQKFTPLYHEQHVLPESSVRIMHDRTIARATLAIRFGSARRFTNVNTHTHTLDRT